MVDLGRLEERLQDDREVRPGAGAFYRCRFECRCGLVDVTPQGPVAALGHQRVGTVGTNRAAISPAEFFEGRALGVDQCGE
jgi:hypothetical protein